jgi:putative methionine-R-sulfoxide reductase with GAF domain
MVVLYVLGGLVLGAFTGVAAHYNPHVGLGVLGACVTVLMVLAVI